MEAIIFPLALIVILIGFVAYVKALVNAAKTSKWVWFVLMLLMWPIFFFYLLMAYESPSTSRYSGGGQGRS
jgi:hypothetical protein